jgi:hypothetical protein
MKTSSTLARFLNLMSAIRDLSPFELLNAEEELLLNDLIVRWYGSATLTVGEVIVPRQHQWHRFDVVI